MKKEVRKQQQQQQCTKRLGESEKTNVKITWMHVSAIWEARLAFVEQWLKKGKQVYCCCTRFTNSCGCAKNQIYRITNDREEKRSNHIEGRRRRRKINAKEKKGKINIICLCVCAHEEKESYQRVCTGASRSRLRLHFAYLVTQKWCDLSGKYAVIVSLSMSHSFLFSRPSFLFFFN